jgi:hypothetical protein
VPHSPGVLCGTAPAGGTVVAARVQTGKPSSR